MVKRILIIVIVILFNSLCWASNAISLPMKGPVGPATADFIVKSIENNQDKDLIVLTIDTPGGLDKSTRIIIQAILASKVPIVGYVSPKGARAASAGTFILYATPIAAMAPGTHLGAASPVNLTDAMGDKKKNSTMKNKVTNDAIAYIKTLAQHHQRDSKFAVKAVQNAATMTALDALKNHVINFIASDEQDLLKQLNGYSFKLNGKKITLETTKLTLQPVEIDWRTRLLLIITSPTVAYLLLMLGVYGIFFELVNPGAIIPGVIGAIAMLFALYALQLLPINYAGLSLIILGLLFMLAEAFIPSFGALGIGGIIAFVIGSFLLIDTPDSSYRIATSIIWAITAVNALFFFIIINMAIRARKSLPENAVNRLIGQTGIVLQASNSKGQAKISGEIWKIQSSDLLQKGSTIKVIAVNGLTLQVTKE